MTKHNKSKKVCFVSLWSIPIVASICLIMTGCSDNTVVPPTAQQQFGLKGTVVDSSGKGLDSVSVYCLYFSSSIPPEAASQMKLTRISGVDTFSFKLYQNFPNPFAHSTFTRFSLPRDAAIRLSVKDRLDGSIKYIYVDTLLQGLYQVYLYHLVDTLRLRNGSYTCVLEATAAGDVRYSASMEMFVISDSGAPSATTNARGSYLFDYSNAFVGDSVVWTSDGNYVYTVHLMSNVCLLFRRDGYRSETLNATLFPNILLQRDVVLIKED